MILIKLTHFFLNANYRLSSVCMCFLFNQILQIRIMLWMIQLKVMDVLSWMIRRVPSQTLVQVDEILHAIVLTYNAPNKHYRDCLLVFRSRQVVIITNRRK